MWTLALASALAANWPDLSSPPKGDGAAVVVGIDDYLIVDDVPGATANAGDWYSWLIQTRGIPLSKVRILRDSDAVRESILEEAEWAASQVGPGGTLWFVFIGHGAPGKDGQDGLLVGADAQQTARSLYARSVPQKELLSVLGAGSQAQTMVLLDACFSGQAQDGALVEGLQPMIPSYAVSTPAKTTVLTAGKSDEFAGPLPGVRRPAFSYLMLGALWGWGDADADGTVTATEAVDYTRGALTALLTDRRQTPQLDGNAALALGMGKAAGPDLLAMVRAGDKAPAPSDDYLSRFEQDAARRAAEEQAVADKEATLRKEAAELADKQQALRATRQKELEVESGAEWARVQALLEGADNVVATGALQAFLERWSDRKEVVGGQEVGFELAAVTAARSALSTRSGMSVEQARSLSDEKLAAACADSGDVVACTEVTCRRKASAPEPPSGGQTKRVKQSKGTRWQLYPAEACSCLEEHAERHERFERAEDFQETVERAETCWSFAERAAKVRGGADAWEAHDGEVGLGWYRLLCAYPAVDKGYDSMTYAQQVMEGDRVAACTAAGEQLDTLGRTTEAHSYYLRSLEADQYFGGLRDVSRACLGTAPSAPAPLPGGGEAPAPAPSVRGSEPACAALQSRLPTLPNPSLYVLVRLCDELEMPEACDALAHNFSDRSTLDLSEDTVGTVRGWCMAQRYQPHSCDMLILNARTLIENGAPDRAIPILTGIDSNEAIRWHGEALWALGQKGPAKKMWATAQGELPAEVLERCPACRR